MSLKKNPIFVLNSSESDLKGETKHFYEFKSFRLDVVERQLLHNDSPVPLTLKAFDVLALLVERGGHLVEKEEILDVIWANSFVEEQNITHTIHTLRKVLGDDGNGNKFTFPRKDRLEIYQKVYETAGWIGVRRELAESLGKQNFDLARLYALQGEKDAAFETLNKSVEKREWHIVTLKVEPAFDSLRDDPRFDEFLGRVGLK